MQEEVDKLDSKRELMDTLGNELEEKSMQIIDAEEQLERVMAAPARCAPSSAALARHGAHMCNV